MSWKQKRPVVTIRDIHGWCTHSVYESLLERANWIDKLDISPQAKRLTRLRGLDFQIAVDRILLRRAIMRRFKPPHCVIGKNL